MNNFPGPCHPRGRLYCHHNYGWFHCGDKACNRLVKIDSARADGPPEDYYDNHGIGSRSTCKFRNMTCDICGINFRGFHEHEKKDERYGEPVTIILCSPCKSQVGAKLVEPRRGFRYAPFYMYPLPILSMALAYFVTIPMWGMEPNAADMITSVIGPLWMMSRCKE